MHAVYLGIKEAAASCGERPVVTVSLEPSDDGSALVITSADASGDCGRIVLELGKGRDME
jgi:hypothetical protein